MANSTRVTRHPVRIEPIPGEYGRFYAHSDRKRKGETGQTHIVDFNGSKPECSCMNYTVECVKNYRKERKVIRRWKEDGTPEENYTMCKHIQAAIEYLLEKSDPKF